MGENPELNSAQEGAKKTLQDVLDDLKEKQINDYIIVGGWCPYLRNEDRNLTHSGTLDVDLLLRDEQRMNELIAALLKVGYSRSANHKFQLLKKREISGYCLTYNIDLLHPSMTQDNPDLFQDHFSLDENEKIASIMLPIGQVLFTETLFDNKNNFSMNLIDFIGLFLTKMDSCQSKKRPRDAFDIYVAFKNKIDLSRIKVIQERNKDVAQSIIKFKDYLSNNAATFNQNVKKYCADLNEDSSVYVLTKLET